MPKPNQEAGGPLCLQFKPLTPRRWPDLEQLFGERGACGGCWCMAWRLTRSEFAARKGARNRRAFKALVASGPPPGILAYDGARPIGWCAIAPRGAFPALTRSRVLAPVDDCPVWSITCLFVDRGYRRRGVSVELLRAASEHAARQGASIVEGYPVEPWSGSIPDVFAWTGIPAAFRAAGFRERLRRSRTRPIMRRSLEAQR